MSVILESMNLIADFSLFWLIPISLISFGITFYVYQNKGWVKELIPWQKNTLRLLRFSSIILILSLLLGLIFQATNYREEKPVFITLVDNSSSMLNYKDSSTIKSNIAALKAKLKTTFGDRFQFVELLVGSKVSTNKIDFKENVSALELGFEKINIDYYNRNIGGIAFISDGNYNVGANPSYAAEKISLTPIFSLLVGDTIPKKDHFIKHITVNDIAFLKNEFPLEVDIEAYKIGAKNVVLGIYQNGQKIASQSVNYTSEKTNFKQVNFTLKADKIGIQTYTVKLESVDGEYTYQNNQRNFYVEVIDSRNKVLLLSGAPHPDISAIRNVLEGNESSETITSLTSEWNKSLDGVNLVIWHEPGIKFEQSILDIIKLKKIPVLYVIGPNTSNSVISKLNIGVSTASGNQVDDNQAAINNSFSSFELSEKVLEELDYFPPLKSKFGQITLSSSNEILLNQRIGKITKKDPLVFFSNKNNIKYGVIFGEGIWRWKMNDYIRNSNQEAFNELFGKIINYLLVKQQQAGLRVEFPKRLSVDEEVFVNASFYNSSLEAITTPKISIDITDQNGKIYKSQFGVLGTGYKLALGKLKAGKYSWTAKTNFNGKLFSKNGSFIIEDVLIEKMESNANQGVMKQLALQSNGKFYFLRNYSNVIKDISKRDDIVTVRYAETTFDDLIDFIWLFVFIFFLLSSEWFLRRWFGSY